jgi:hypothetical protein
VVDVVENPRRRSKRNSIFLTPAVMQSIGQTGVGRMLTRKNGKGKHNPDILYQNGDFYLIQNTHGDYLVFKNSGTHAVKVATIGKNYKGTNATARAYAISELDRRASSKRNPESDAAALYEEFHGKPSEQLTEYVYEEHEHDSLAQLGELISVTVLTTTGYEAKIDAPSIDGPVNDVVQLCSSEDRRQLYFVGGNQTIDVDALGFSDADIKDLMVIGVLTQVEYCTKKKFHKFKPVDYYHELGEETGVQPILLYDPISQLMKVAGGAYEVRMEGIVN